MSRFEIIASYRRIFGLSWAEAVRIVDEVFGFVSSTNGMGY